MIQNSQLLEYIGETKTKNLMEKITKEYFEIKEKTFPDPKYDISSMSIVTVNDIDETEIKGIGMSCVDDLLVENFLIWLHGIMRGTGDFAMIETDTQVKQVRFSGGSFRWNFANANGNIGTRIQVGQGVITPNFSDVRLDTIFGNSPESLALGTTDGFYSVGLTQAKCSRIFSPTGGSGAVSESAFIISCKATNDGIIQLMFAHDSISPVVNFLVGQSINVEYTFQF